MLKELELSSHSQERCFSVRTKRYTTTSSLLPANANICAKSRHNLCSNYGGKLRLQFLYDNNNNLYYTFGISCAQGRKSREQ